MIRALCLLVAVSTPAAAQTFDAAAAVAGAWNTFSTRCAEVLNDPQTYLTTHPTTGPENEQLVGSSPDGQVVTTYRSEGEYYFRVELLGLPGRLAVLCEGGGLSSHGLDDLRSLGTTDPYAAVQSVKATSEAYATAARAHFGAMPDTYIAGGVVPDAIPQSMTGMFGESYGSYIFGVQTPLAGRQAFVWVGAHLEGLLMISLNYIEAGG